MDVGKSMTHRRHITYSSMIHRICGSHHAAGKSHAGVTGVLRVTPDRLRVMEIELYRLRIRRYIDDGVRMCL